MAGCPPSRAEGNEEPCAFLYVDVQPRSSSYSVAAVFERSDDDSGSSHSEPVSPC